MIRPTTVLLLVGIFAGVFAGSAAAAPPTGEITGVRIGFVGRYDGGDWTAAEHYKVGVWTPVEISLSRGAAGDPSRLIVTIPDGDGVPSRVSASVPVTEDPVAVLLYARFGRIQSEITVAWESDETVIDQWSWESPAAVGAGQPMIVTVGADPLGVDLATETLRRETEDQIVVASLKDCAGLPTKWYGYEGVDALMISAGPEIELSQSQADALEEWIAMGGRLVLCVGPQAETVLHKDSPLGRFAPGRLKALISLRQTGALEFFAHSTVPIIRSEDRLKRSTLKVPRLTEIEGVIEASEADVPLVVRTPHVFGQIVFLAGDLDRGLLAKWEDRSQLAAQLLDLPTQRSDESHDAGGEMGFGFDDMSGQLRSSLDRFQRVRRVPFSWMVVLIVAYLVMIGPIDYFFLRKLTRRMQWTWITFPAIVIVFCIAAYVLACRSKGDQMRVHHAVLVDVDVKSGRLRGTSWANVFSPRTDCYNLSLRPGSTTQEDPRQPDPLVSWLGLPGRGIGGMNPRAKTLMTWSDPYDFSPDLATMEDVPILVWSTKSLTARWSALGAESPEAELKAHGSSLTGHIRNPFDFPLNDCILAHKRWVYVLDTLEPGDSVRLDSMTKRSELKTLLTGRKIVYTEKKDHYRQEATPYDPTSLDPAYILRLMMFHKEAGGEQYTHLSNAYQSFVDLSDLLKTGRAVLVARAPQTCLGATWLCNGEVFDSEESEPVTILRFVFPVEEEE